MRRQGSWRRKLGRCLLAASLAAGPSCMTMLHPVKQPEQEYAQACRALPQGARDHVHIFFVHGLDPLDYANIGGVVDYVQKLGFHKTHYGQLYHGFYFDQDIRQIHLDDPDARFVLIGFSFGANVVRSLAQSVKKDGVQIDLLVYLGGNTLDDQTSRPDNALRVVNVLAQGSIWNGSTLEDAENTYLPDVRHFGSPTHPYTLEMLARELSLVAGTVTVVEVLPPPLPGGEEPPTPRPVRAQARRGNDEWGFLRPAAHLGGRSGVEVYRAARPHAEHVEEP